MRANGSWLVIRVVSPSADAAALLSEGLFASGATAVEEDGTMLRTWLPATDAPESVVASVRARLEAADTGTFELHWDVQDGQDWLAKWRDGLSARRIGRRIIVAPSWTRVDAATADVVIVIDPQMAFGTGEHASTRGILRLLEDVVPADGDVLDVGTGSAVLAIAAAKLGAARVHAVDADADALINAAENVERNQVSVQVRLEQAMIDRTWLDRNPAAFDVIVANVLSGVLHPLLDGFGRALRPGGVLLLAGILHSEAETMRTAAGAAGFAFDAEDREEEWWCGRFRTRRAARQHSPSTGSPSSDGSGTVP